MGLGEPVLPNEVTDDDSPSGIPGNTRNGGPGGTNPCETSPGGISPDQPPTDAPGGIPSGSESSIPSGSSMNEPGIQGRLPRLRPRRRPLSLVHASEVLGRRSSDGADDMNDGTPRRTERLGQVVVGYVDAPVDASTDVGPRRVTGVVPDRSPALNRCNLLDEVGVTRLWGASTDSFVQPHRATNTPGALRPVAAVITKDSEDRFGVDVDYDAGHFTCTMRRSISSQHSSGLNPCADPSHMGWPVVACCSKVIPIISRYASPTRSC